jgi:hypothetical protein
MRRLRVRILSAVIALAPIAALAATPTSITLTRKGQSADGRAFEVHTVKCSDGTLKSITGWDDRKLWCQGEEGSSECEKKFIKAARAACRS